ncbi:Hypothetical predicted protein [Octopus vulgaris]|uniref:Uncharacterized protein n=1 Tax=Octopus vulgaris TaxID=6645 RepID=A0AA36B5J8_OCTVU|nr:Hypothetical predicted protein [Octopus vulgaris]
MSRHQKTLSQMEIEEILYEDIPSDNESTCDDEVSDEAILEQNNVLEEETANIEFDDLSESDSNDVPLASFAGNKNLKWAKPNFNLVLYDADLVEKMFTTTSKRNELHHCDESDGPK